ncbi:SAM-dependent methyltransferase [Phenylobacterium terrae]|uniref:SAM-dependent methyltransferase n=1 Tax=Phenylobacterium terrae TaxID=2665495 RepID=A0ABW4N2K6_9CAUL
MGRRISLRAALAMAAGLLLAGCTEVGEGRAAPRPEAGAALRKPDVRYEPSPHKVVRAMLELAKVGEQDVVYDLGSGDGRIPIAAARDFGARAVGIDIDPKLVARAKDNARKAGVADRVSFRNEDLFAADFSEATVVTLFLYPDVNLKLRPRLLATLKPGTRVVSHMHSMGDWRPQRTIRADGRDIHLWVIPEGAPSTP